MDVHQSLPVAMDYLVDAILTTTSTAVLNINPAPGTELVYTVECVTAEAAAVFYNGETSPLGESNLWLIAHPPR